MWALSWESTDYPEKWREMNDAPPVIFGRGEPFLKTVQSPHIAIVGTRRCTSHAITVSFELGKIIASSGGVVVSGLACGVDEAAHRGACYAGFRTVGILGGPPYPVQPHSSRAVAEEMLDKSGAVLSEHALGGEVLPWHFASRNRLVVALSEALVLVQSPARGGGLISASLAIESGVDCWVYRPPARLQNSRWYGNLGWTEVDELVTRLMGPSISRAPFASEHTIPGSFRRIWHELHVLGGGQINVVARALGVPEESLRSQLYCMEMQGWVKRIPGGWYVPLRA
jgi:DNA processing protein